MRAFIVSLLLLAAWAADARVSTQRLGRIQISGSDYVRVDEWAAAEGLSGKWNRSSGTITLVGASSRIDLTVGSRRTEISGVTVWLSLPVVNHGGGALISAVDAGTTIGAILFPKKGEGRLQKICLDPGHGGKDKGEIDGHRFEKDYALLLAQEVAVLLKNNGINVVLTRKNDTLIDLPARPLIAKRADADLFVSLHYNSAGHDVRGVSVYCLAPAGMNSSDEGGGKAPFLHMAGNAHDEQNAFLAYELQKSITAHTTLQDRGVKRARFEVLREATVPAVLIEGGFMSNPADAKNIYDSAFRKRMAQAITDGLLAYKRAADRF
jgi:N-acetylmuramoyl-L-alanine amidase